MVESVTASGRMELQFKLREPHAPLLASLAIPAASLISPTFINQRTPVGTGPFRFKEWIPNERIVLEANPHHWDAPPAFATLIFKVVPDNATRLIQLQTGQVHAMDGLDPGDLPVVTKDARLRILSGPGLNVCYLALNTQRAALQDKLARRAIAAAINKPDILTAVYRDAAVLAKNPLPPFIAGHNDKIPAAHTKPDGVQPPAQSLTLHVMTNPRVYLPNPLRAAQLIKADLEKAGFQIEIVSNEWGAHLDRTQRGEHDLAILGWVGDTGDADNFLYVLLDKDTATMGSALNIAFWKHDPYHELMMAARKEVDPEKRAALYRQAQEMIFEECPMVPLAHARNLVITRAEMENLLLQPNGDILFHRVTLPR
jgi:peptide/nickel transport system substrate-binding protein